jgi:hypothetical protein
MSKPAKLDQLRQSPAVSSTAEADPKLLDGEFHSVSHLIEEVRCLRARNEQLTLGLREIRQLLTVPLPASW